MNRIIQHLSAIRSQAPLPAIAKPAPAKGESCYVVHRFDPTLIEGWHPQHIEDAPPAVESDDCEPMGRFHGIHVALDVVRRFNAPKLADWRHSRQWAALFWVDGPLESAGYMGGLSVGPLSYVVARCYPALDWRPKSLWDIPAGQWIDEQSPTRMKSYPDSAAAIIEAQRANMRYRRGKADSGQWSVVLAIEADPIHEIGLLQWRGRNFAQLTATIQRRMHVVDRRWPGVMDSLKGGAR